MIREIPDTRGQDKKLLVLEEYDYPNHRDALKQRHYEKKAKAPGDKNATKSTKNKYQSAREVRAAAREETLDSVTGKVVRRDQAQMKALVQLDTYAGGAFSPQGGYTNMGIPGSPKPPPLSELFKSKEHYTIEDYRQNFGSQTWQEFGGLGPDYYCERALEAQKKTKALHTMGDEANRINVDTFSLIAQAKTDNWPPALLKKERAFVRVKEEAVPTKDRGNHRDLLIFIQDRQDNLFSRIPEWTKWDRRQVLLLVQLYSLEFWAKVVYDEDKKSQKKRTRPFSTSLEFFDFLREEYAKKVESDEEAQKKADELKAMEEEKKRLQQEEIERARREAAKLANDRKAKKLADQKAAKKAADRKIADAIAAKLEEEKQAKLDKIRMAAESEELLVYMQDPSLCPIFSDAAVNAKVVLADAAFIISVSKYIDKAKAYMKEALVEDLTFATVQLLLDYIDERANSGMPIIDDNMRRVTFEYLGRHANFFSESAAELQISVRQLDGLLKKFQSVEAALECLEKMDHVGCSFHSFEEMCSHIDNIQEGGPVAQMKNEWVDDVKHMVQQTLHADHPPVSDTLVQQVIHAARGVRRAKHQLELLIAHHQTHTDEESLLDHLSNNALFHITVTDDMTDEVLDFLGKHAETMFHHGSENLEFTVGEIEDLIIKCLGPVGVINTLSLLNDEKPLFETFQDMANAVHPVHAPNRAGCYAMLNFIRDKKLCKDHKSLPPLASCKDDVSRFIVDCCGVEKLKMVLLKMQKEGRTSKVAWADLPEFTIGYIRGEREFSAKEEIHAPAGSQDFLDFQRVFEKIAQPDQKPLREAAWKEADPNGNGLCSLAEIDGWVKFRLTKELGNGDDVWRVFRPSYIRAFTDAKDIGGMKRLNPNSDTTTEDYVQKNEFRLCVAYLVIYAQMFDAFSLLDGGDTEADDRKLTKEEFIGGLPKLVDYRFSCFSKVFNHYNRWHKATELDEEICDDVFKEMDADGKGAVLFSEFCRYVEQGEQAEGTDIGKLLAMGDDDEEEEAEN